MKTVEQTKSMEITLSGFGNPSADAVIGYLPAIIKN
jgi:hypothetical protein